ncbi:MAG: phosphoribosylanthranilate isomerase [Candidatus Latescibacteria bacterium]|nr:phosphoribosylanthranilate isomerase [Candidatus Latescibacterota bacterium]
MTRVKICGITRTEDALQAAALGADWIGFVMAPSPRRIEPAAVGRIARRLAEAHPAVGRVGVFVDPTVEEIEEAVEAAALTHVQIHGTAPERLPAGIPWIAALGLTGPEGAAVPPGDPWGLLVEPRIDGRMGGTGQTFPWDWARPLAAFPRLFVAGGLDAERVTALLRVLRPFAVDASSRLETAPGVKDPGKLEAFFTAVRAAETESEGELE